MVILLSAVISEVDNLTSVINSLKLLSIKDAKRPFWLFYFALDDKKD